MQFYFIRHAQSANNHLWDQTGSNRGRSEDAELTPRGLRQAELLAAYLGQSNPAAFIPAAPGYARDAQNRAGFGLTHLYTSLMVRAVNTGTIVAQALGLPLVGWLDWHEGGGVYLEDEDTGERAGLPGNDRAYFAEHFPACILPDDFPDSGWWNERPYESHEERQARAQRVLQGLLERHGGTEDRVAVISHGNFYNYFIGALLGMPVREGYWLLMNNAAITRVDFRPQETVLTYCNRADFLPGELIT
jgi:2,3-bisphosphoglycerate-dependent phosphoglycerate mutase